MKLRQTKLLRPADDDGVRPGAVEATLHDIGRKEHVRFTFDEAHHSIVDILGRQPAMETYDAKVRGCRLHPCQQGLQILDTGANQKTLPVTSLLTQQSRGDRSVR